MGVEPGLWEGRMGGVSAGGEESGWMDVWHWVEDGVPGGELGERLGLDDMVSVLQ